MPVRQLALEKTLNQVIRQLPLSEDMCSGLFKDSDIYHVFMFYFSYWEVEILSLCTQETRGTSTQGPCFPNPGHTPEPFSAAMLPALPAGTGGAARASVYGWKGVLGCIALCGQQARHP